MAKDPYQYFRIEARELLAGLTRGLLDIEKNGPAANSIAVLLRLAHTLKGAARVVKQTEISKHAHDLEEILAPYRAGDRPIQNDHITAMLSHIDAMTALIGLLGSGETAHAPKQRAAPATPAPAPLPDELLESVRVDNVKLDGLQQHVHVAGIQLAGLLEQLRSVKQTVQLSGVLSAQLGRGNTDASGALQWRDSLFKSLNAEKLHGALTQLQDSLSTGLERVSAELSEVQEFVNQFRLRPASSIFGLLERAVRDAAQLQNKRVEFLITGGEYRLDAHILAALRDALLHIVRNAVAHGIESEAQRTAAGKPPAGRITLTVERRANRIAFICRDDGRGLDAAAIRQAAVDRGLLSSHQAAALNLDGLIKLLLKGGVSTAAATTEVAGRGIGLDIARSTLARLKGTLEVRTVPGVETVLELCVPVSLASVTGLRLEVAGTFVCIPLDQVRRTVRLKESELVHANEGVCLVLDGRSIPYVALENVLKLPSTRRGGRKQISAIIVESEAGQAALGADRLRSTATVVAQKLPAYLAADETVLGAFMNENGDPELLLDPVAIVRRAQTRTIEFAAAAPPAAPPLLVIDDSLTTRMLEQSILESAGYRVDLAVSAEDGLEKARERSYGLFIVDVEMPGMSGFDFVEHIRTQPDLRDTPCILVTSRNAPEDKARGKRVGAQAYIVKSEFNQDVLLQTIRGLLDVAHPRTRG